MTLAGDPHAWLLPYFARLCRDPTFSNLAPAFQFEALCQAVATDHPGRATDMSSMSAAAQSALLLWLTDAARGSSASAKDVTLWAVRKGERTLVCLAVDVTNGFDLRLMDGGEFRRTELFPELATVKTRAGEWLTALKERGWLLDQEKQPDK